MEIDLFWNFRMITVPRRKRSWKFCFNLCFVTYVALTSSVALLYIWNSLLIPGGLYFTNSQYQTNVNIQFYKPNDNGEMAKFHKVVQSSGAKKKQQNGTKPGWQQNVYRQNHVYDHPVIRRIDGLNVYYLTAVASNTSASTGWNRVVINGWETVWRKEGQPKFYCCFDTNGQMDIAEVSKKHTWGLRINGVIAAVQFICNMSASGSNVTATRVALTQKPICKERGLKFVNIDKAYLMRDNSIGVCAKIAYGKFQAERILEWLEVNKEMGVDHVVLFTYNLTKDAMKVIQHYSQNGYVTQREFDFPMKMTYPRHLGQKYTLSWHDEQVVVFDCMERLQGYHFVAVLDLDEFLIPRMETYHDWKIMLEKLSWKYPYAAGFSFQSEVFTLDWGVSNPEGEFFVTKYINRTRSMWDRRKNIINPQKVVPGSVWTHGFRSLKGFRQQNTSSLVANILHYRTCRTHWIQQGTCLSNRSRFKDNTMLRVIPRVRDRLVALREELLGRENTTVVTS